MSKRKQTADVDGDEQELVDVHFDYYNVNATNDYHAIHRLFIQLFGPDSERIQTGPLTDLVMSVAEESGVGSTIKMEEDSDSDPYAILTVISCRDHPGLQGLIAYVLSKTSVDPEFHAVLSSLLQTQHVGLVLSERLVNMPVQVMAPMYTMLADELITANSSFTHFLFLSRVYRLEEEDEERQSKRSKSTPKDGLYGFHPEDEVIMDHAMHVTTYTFTDGPESHVGVEVAGRAMLVSGPEFKVLVHAIEETYTV